MFTALRPKTVLTLAPIAQDDDQLRRAPSSSRSPFPLPNHPFTRRSASMLTLVVSLAMLAAALLGPSQTLAQTRKLTCVSATAHTRAKHGAHGCTRSAHKRKTHHSTTRHTGHALAKTPQEVTPATTPAACEDGSAPVQASDGSFSCGDGSEPECEEGSAPTLSADGKSLVCLLPSEGEFESGEAECEEGLGNECGLVTLSDADEQTCARTASSSSSFLCEAES